ncbi:hypothetical protein EON65_58610 [archaeon]|nr:MAG: hypothetical protein EON65_58610 [archaeon]
MLSSSRHLIRATLRDFRAGSSLLGGVRTYHENIVDHYENPRNVGSLDKNKKNVGTGRIPGVVMSRFLLLGNY